jgi:hypothetical protein
MSFAAGLRWDEAAVTAGLTVPWSSGVASGWPSSAPRERNHSRIPAVFEGCTGARGSGVPASLRRRPLPIVKSRSPREGADLVHIWECGEIRHQDAESLRVVPDNGGGECLELLVHELDSRFDRLGVAGVRERLPQ